MYQDQITNLCDGQTLVVTNVTRGYDIKVFRNLLRKARFDHTNPHFNQYFILNNEPTKYFREFSLTEGIYAINYGAEVISDLLHRVITRWSNDGCEHTITVLDHDAQASPYMYGVFRDCTAFHEAKQLHPGRIILFAYRGKYYAFGSDAKMLFSIFGNKYADVARYHSVEYHYTCHYFVMTREFVNQASNLYPVTRLGIGYCVIDHLWNDTPDCLSFIDKIISE